MTPNQKRRLLAIVPANLADDDLDIAIGEAKRLVSSLRDNTAWKDAQARRAQERQSMVAKLDELVAEAESRGIRVKKPKGKP